MTHLPARLIPCAYVPTGPPWAAGRFQATRAPPRVRKRATGPPIRPSRVFRAGRNPAFSRILVWNGLPMIFKDSWVTGSDRVALLPCIKWCNA